MRTEKIKKKKDIKIKEAVKSKENKKENNVSNPFLIIILFCLCVDLGSFCVRFVLVFSVNVLFVVLSMCNGCLALRIIILYDGILNSQNSELCLLYR